MTRPLNYEASADTRARANPRFAGPPSRLGRTACWLALVSLILVFPISLITATNSAGLDTALWITWLVGCAVAVFAGIPLAIGGFFERPRCSARLAMWGLLLHAGWLLAPCVVMAVAVLLGYHPD